MQQIWDICNIQIEVFRVFSRSWSGGTPWTDAKQEDFNHRIVEYALLVVANAVTSAAMGVAIQTLGLQRIRG